jgi:hypothetical protein
VVDLANYTPASAEKGYLSAARFMSPELLSRFEPVAREQLKQVVTNRVSQFFTVDSYKVEGKDPLVVRFLGERITYVGRTETERKPYEGGVPIVVENRKGVFSRYPKKETDSWQESDRGGTRLWAKLHNLLVQWKICWDQTL